MIENIADINGGAIWSDSGIQLSLFYYSSFIRNKAAEKGGALFQTSNLNSKSREIKIKKNIFL